MSKQLASEIMIRPVLEYLSDGLRHTNTEIQNHISKPENHHEALSEGTRKNWVAFALKNLQRAEAITKIEFDEYQVNQRGLELLQQGHEQVTVEVLKQYPEMRQSLHIAAMRAAANRREKKPADA